MATSGDFVTAVDTLSIIIASQIPVRQAVVRHDD